MHATTFTINVVACMQRRFGLVLHWFHLPDIMAISAVISHEIDEVDVAAQESSKIEVQCSLRRSFVRRKSVQPALPELTMTVNQQPVSSSTHLTTATSRSCTYVRTYLHIIFSTSTCWLLLVSETEKGCSTEVINL